MLFIQQFSLIAVQICLTTGLTSSPTPTFSSALFESINVRHAGFDCIDLSTLSSGVLLVFMIMMYLAPAPHISALKSSMLKVNKLNNEADMNESRVGFGRTSNFSSGTRSFVSANDEESNVSSNNLGGNAQQQHTQKNFQITKNSRKLSLTLSKDNRQHNLRAGTAKDAFAGSWSEKACRRSGVSTLTRKSIIRRSKSKNLFSERHELDTRLLILTEFGEDQKVPVKVKVLWRLRAVKYQLKKSLFEFWNKVRDRPNFFFLLFVWFLICCIEGWKDDKPSVFNSLFEIISCFGNVGLSLGSSSADAADGVAFSHDLKTGSMALLIVVMVWGRTREIPAR